MYKCLEIFFEHDSKGIICVWRFRSLASKPQELPTTDLNEQDTSIIDKTTFINTADIYFGANLTAVYNWSDMTGPINKYYLVHKSCVKFPKNQYTE